MTDFTHNFIIIETFRFLGMKALNLTSQFVYVIAVNSIIPFYSKDQQFSGLKNAFFPSQSNIVVPFISKFPIDMLLPLMGRPVISIVIFKWRDFYFVFCVHEIERNLCSILSIHWWFTRSILWSDKYPFEILKLKIDGNNFSTVHPSKMVWLLTEFNYG